MTSAPPVPTRPASRGRAEPLGACVRDGGVNFAVFAGHATAVDLCLFDGRDAQGGAEVARVPLHGPHDGVWHAFVPGLAPGQVYGLRAHGPHAPAQGHRYNPHKLLLDPAAREIVGRFDWRPEHHGYVLGDKADSFDRRDNAAHALKARVAAPWPDTPRPPPPRIPPDEVVLYELHLRGFGMRCPGLPEPLRGTYAGLAHPAAVAHFQALGVTTLSLLPVHYRLSEPMLPPGLVNHWGYNTLGFFCADPRLSCTPDDTAAANAEFRAMVDALHAAGLEVVLDVVYNHTPEGNEFGPTLSFRGLDQAAWYRLDERGRPLNWSACGNTLNLGHPQVVRFVMDSLRWWVQAMGVDGFRFDLAAVLGRGRDGAFDRESPFFTALLQDPVLARAHLIAEPWDAGPDGYRVGDFPGRFAAWNDRFRDAARAFWLNAGDTLANRRALAEAVAGSPHTFRSRQRLPTASVNFVTAHDGFTLADLVAHARKHNEANGEDNRDGRDDELCANFGAEGPTGDATINATRHAVQRALLATLALSHGTPMLLAGDEFGHTQRGNNNAWNQDNPLGWLAWARAATRDGRALQALVAELLALRRAEPRLRPADWHDAPLHWHALDDDAVALVAEVAPGAGRRLVLAFNPAPEPRPWPAGFTATGLHLRLDSRGAHAPGTAAPARVPPRCLLVLAAPEARLPDPP